MKFPPLALYDLDRIAKSCVSYARGHGVTIRVEFDASVPGPCTTSDGTIKMPVPDPKGGEDSITQTLHGTYHEVAHHVYGPGAFKIIHDNAIRMDHPLGMLLNITEDDRIEPSFARDMYGVRETFKRGHTLIADKWVNEIVPKNLEMYPTMDPNMAKIYAVMGWQTACASDWSPGLGLLARTISKIDNDILQDSLGKLLSNSTLATRLKSAESEQDTFELSKDIFDLLWEDEGKNAEEEIEKLKEQKAKQEAKPEKDENGEPIPCEIGDGDGDPIKIDMIPEEGKVPWQDMPKVSEHDESGRGSGKGIDYSTYSHEGRTVVFQPPDTLDIQHPTGAGYSEGRYSDYSEYIGSSSSDLLNNEAITNRIRMLLQSRAATKFEPFLKRGHIDSGRTYRLAMPSVDAGAWNAKIFRKRIDTDVLNTAVSLMIDISGSMDGIKNSCAAEAARLTAHTLISLNIPCAVYTFQYKSGGTQVSVLKNFDERVDSDKILKRYFEACSYMGGNADHDAILYAYHEAKSRKERRKVLFVYSDGSPADCWHGDGAGYGDPYNALKDTVQAIEEEKAVEVYGIGIRDDNVKHFYTDNTVVTDLSTLGTQIIQILEHKLVP